MIHSCDFCHAPLKVSIRVFSNVREDFAWQTEKRACLEHIEEVMRVTKSLINEAKRHGVA